MNGNDLAKTISEGLQSIRNEVVSTESVTYDSSLDPKPFFSVQGIGNNIWRIGNVVGSNEMVAAIVDKNEQITLYDKINNVSTALWNFETKNGLEHKMYALTGFNSINDFKVQSVHFHGTQIHVDGKTIAGIINKNMDISAIR